MFFEILLSLSRLDTSMRPSRFLPDVFAICYSVALLFSVIKVKLSL
jgi:hypothetical protein